MNLLRAVYESARVNIPIKLFPDRATVVPWDALHEEVRTELARLAQKVQSVVRSDERRLANHRRVIGEFNRGVREGLFGGEKVQSSTVSESPYEWGHEIGRRAALSGRVDPETVKQFITATHLLAYEFGQLDQARAGALEFVVRNTGPQRADELGALAFALPVLINYRRPLAAQMLRDAEFSPATYQAAQPPAPSHLEYLTQGIVALFDPSPESWVRVAANMTLAAQPFLDGADLRSEHFQAPVQAVDMVRGAPIAAWTAVRRQVDRVLLAREWHSRDSGTISLDDERVGRVTLWSVYQSLPASRIRGGDLAFGDLLASNIVYLVSLYFDHVIPPEQTGFQFLRRHFGAFIRGFDTRIEGVVDTRALSSAGRGRAISEGLRRFAGGGIYIGQVSDNLQQLAASLNELQHAYENPVEFALEQLEANKETPLAAKLLVLLRGNAVLARQLFGEKTEFELYSATHVKVRSAYDMLRSALHHVTLAVRPDQDSHEKVGILLGRAREDLGRIQLPDSMVQDPALEDTVAMARMLLDDFDTLVRVLRAVTHRLYYARALARPRGTSSGSHLGDIIGSGIIGAA